MRRAAPFRVAVMCVVFIAACESMVHGDRGPRPQSGPDQTGPGGRVFLARGTNVPEAAHSMHLSTGLIGAQHRYVMMIESQAAGRRRNCPRHHHPGRQDNVPRRAHLSPAP
jgi:hypothetical protein